MFKVITMLVGIVCGLGRLPAEAVNAARRRRATARTEHRARLTVEGLETRLTPSVTWWMSGSTLKLASDAASDWMSVQIVGDGRVWFNGTGMPGAQSKLVSQVSAIDMSGGGGNDNINVLQTAPFANKPIRIYGNDGDDTINLDLRADGSAQYSADGGNGWDTVNVPNWMPVGPGGFPYSLWTNAESRNLSTLAQAQGTLRQNGDMTSIWRQIQAPITNGSNNRSADRYRLLTEQFEVGYYGYSRYIRDGNVTKCNIFAGDVMRAMQVPLPTKDDLGGVDGGGSVTAGAQRLNSWLNGNKTWSSSYPTGPQQGWRKIDIYNQGDLDLLLSYVRAGKPALASTGDHIAVIRPDQEVSQLTKPNLGNLVIAQAGAKNLNRGHLSDVDGWRNIGYQNVQYFVRR